MADTNDMGGIPLDNLDQAFMDEQVTAINQAMDENAKLRKKVERLQGLLDAERQAAAAIATACLGTGLVPQGVAGTVDAVREVCAKLAAARVSAIRLRTECHHECASANLVGHDCDCGAEIAIELLRALDSEVSL